MNILLSNFQHAFIKGRQIGDCYYLSVAKLISTYSKRNWKGLVLKFDFENAIDGGRGGERFLIRGWEYPLYRNLYSSGGITYARIILGANRLIMEGDSLTIVAWLRSTPTMVLPLISYPSSNFRHIYCKVNSVVDWIASLVTWHSDENI